MESERFQVLEMRGWKTEYMIRPKIRGDQLWNDEWDIVRKRHLLKNIDKHVEMCRALAVSLKRIGVKDVVYDRSEFLSHEYDTGVLLGMKTEAELRHIIDHAEFLF